MQDKIDLLQEELSLHVMTMLYETQERSRGEWLTQDDESVKVDLENGILVVKPVNDDVVEAYEFEVVVRLKKTREK